MRLDKKAFFGKPTLTAVMEERTAHYVHSTIDLVRLLDTLPKDQVLIIPEIEIALPSAFYSQQNWMKRGKALRLPRHSRDRSQRVGPTRTRHAVYREATLDDYVGGYEWLTTDNRKRKKVLLSDCLAAARLFYFSETSGRKGDQIKVSKGYWSRDESPQFGRTFVVEVPSQSSNDPYVFKVVGVPTENNQHQFSLWRNVTTEGHTGGKKKGNRHEGCERKFYAELTFGRPELVEMFCVHEIAAYMAITQKEHDRQGRVILQPFALPSARTVSVDKALRERVFVEYVARTKKGLRTLRRRPLHLPEREKLWGRYVIKHAKEGVNVFYARDLLKHHEW